MEANQAALLLLDYQTSLTKTVDDITVTELSAIVMALVRIATLLKGPMITTASESEGPNCPLMLGIDELRIYAFYVPVRAK